jgi:hypothetical protein
MLRQFQKIVSCYTWWRNGSQGSAHSDVEALNPLTNTWEKITFNAKHHGTGATLIKGKIYTAAGSLNREDLE